MLLTLAIIVKSFILEGTGQWTDRQQNPAQSQLRAMTIAHGALYLGDIVVIHEVGALPGDRIELRPEVTSFTVEG